MTRLEMVALAQAGAENIAARAPSQFGRLRVVVCVTDEAGEHVGVGITTGGEDAAGILRASLEGRGKTEAITVDVAPEPCACHGDPYCEEDK